MVRVLALILALGISTQVQAAVPKESYVPVSKTLSLFVSHQPATAGSSTIVILNGLTHTTKNWDAFLKHFNQGGHGVLQIDLAGQGQTLSKNGAVTQVVRYQDQAVYIHRILQQLSIQSKVIVLGLSYGGGIATYFASKYPQLISKLILLAPYTEPQPDQDRWIKNQIAATRIAFPYNTATDKELYMYFLRQLVYTVYPSAEPELRYIPYKLEAVFRMCEGLYKLHTAKHSNTLPTNSVYLVGGGSDQLVSPEVLNRFWSALPPSCEIKQIGNKKH